MRIEIPNPDGQEPTIQMVFDPKHARPRKRRLNKKQKRSRLGVRCKPKELKKTDLVLQSILPEYRKEFITARNLYGPKRKVFFKARQNKTPPVKGYYQEWNLMTAYEAYSYLGEGEKRVIGCIACIPSSWGGIVVSLDIDLKIRKDPLDRQTLIDLYTPCCDMLRTEFGIIPNLCQIIKTGNGYHFTFCIKEEVALAKRVGNEYTLTYISGGIKKTHIAKVDSFMNQASTGNKTFYTIAAGSFHAGTNRKYKMMRAAKRNKIFHKIETKITASVKGKEPKGVKKKGQATSLKKLSDAERANLIITEPPKKLTKDRIEKVASILVTRIPCRAGDNNNVFLERLRHLRNVEGWRQGNKEDVNYVLHRASVLEKESQEVQHRNEGVLKGAWDSCCKLYPIDEENPLEHFQKVVSGQATASGNKKKKAQKVAQKETSEEPLGGVVANKTLNKKFLNYSKDIKPLMKKGRTLLVQSTTGTGKTEIIKDAILDCYKNEQKVACITHLVAVVRGAFERVFKADPQLQASNCIQTYMRALKTNFMGFQGIEVLLIDEISSLVELIFTNNRFYKTQYKKIFLHYILKILDVENVCVVAFDADYTRSEMKALKFLFPKVFFLRNKYQRRKTKIIGLDSELELVWRNHARLKKGEKTTFSLNSRRLSDTLGYYTQWKFPKKNFIVSNSRSAKVGEKADYIQSIESDPSLLKDVDGLSYTPHLGRGLDIQEKDRHVFLLADMGQTISPPEQMQALRRTRSPLSIEAFIPRQNRKGTTFANIKYLDNALANYKRIFSQVQPENRTEEDKTMYEYSKEINEVFQELTMENQVNFLAPNMAWATTLSKENHFITGSYLKNDMTKIKGKGPITELKRMLKQKELYCEYKHLQKIRKMPTEEETKIRRKQNILTDDDYAKNQTFNYSQSFGGGLGVRLAFKHGIRATRRDVERIEKILGGKMATSQLRESTTWNAENYKGQEELFYKTLNRGKALSNSQIDDRSLANILESVVFDDTTKRKLGKNITYYKDEFLKYHAFDLEKEGWKDDIDKENWNTVISFFFRLHGLRLIQVGNETSKRVYKCDILRFLDMLQIIEYRDTYNHTHEISRWENKNYEHSTPRIITEILKLPTKKQEWEKYETEMKVTLDAECEKLDTLIERIAKIQQFKDPPNT